MDNPPGASPGVAQPLFLYESSLNWIGLVLIFFVGEYIPKKKVGDLGFIYFVWYGVLRLCLEPLRIHTFTFWPTYLMSSLWVFAGIVLLILSHTLFKRARSYSFVNSIKNKKLTKKTDDEMLYYLGR
jgi:phosphatidylglycerol:prolipoprotein diacylglycerol transferase